MTISNAPEASGAKTQGALESALAEFDHAADQLALSPDIRAGLRHP